MILSGTAGLHSLESTSFSVRPQFLLLFLGLIYGVKAVLSLIYSFRSVVQGNHTLFREYSYIRKTPHNIASFIRVFWKCFRHIGRNGGKVTNQNKNKKNCIKMVGFLQIHVHNMFFI